MADERLALDESKLAAATVAERGEVYVLQFLRRCELALSDLPEETVRASQVSLQANLLKLVCTPATPSVPAPKPGRPVRQLVARCLLLLLTVGDPKPLFDISQALLKVWSDPKMDRENRVATLFVTGALFKELGGQILSMTTDMTIQALKILKNSSNPVHLRYAAINALRDVMQSGGKAVQEVQAKDVAKSLRGLLSDKMAPLQRAAADALLIYYQVGVAHLTLPDMDSILLATIKAFEGCDFTTCHALAKLVAGLLAYTQVEGFAPAPEPSRKRQPTKDGQDDEDPYPSTNPSADQPKSMYTLAQMLGTLSTPFNRPNQTRKTIIGLLAVYAALFTTLGSSFVENNYPEILKHLLLDVGCGPRSQSNAFDALVVRKGVNLLLRQSIGVRLLSEQTQILALREIAVSYLARYPAMLPGQTAPPQTALLLALEEAAGLLEQLGSAPTLVQDAIADPLIRLSNHPAQVVQVAAAYTLKQFCFVAPTKLSSTTSVLVELLNKDLGLLASQPDVKPRAMGHAYALMALISLIPAKPLYVSYDVSARIMSLAIQLLKDSGNHDLSVSKTEVSIAWMLVAALMHLGPFFVKVHLPQLLILWKNALPKPSSKDASASQIRSDQEWSFLLRIREVTLSAILSLLRHATKLVTADIGRRVSVLLANAFSFIQTFPAARHDATSQLTELDLRFKATLLRCYEALPVAYVADSQQLALLQLAAKVMCDPDINAGSAIQAAIAASTGGPVSVWDCVDGLAYGVTSVLREHGLDNGRIGTKEWLNRDAVEAGISELASSPLFLTREANGLASLCTSDESPGTPTALVDACLSCFETYLPLASLQAQTSVLGDVASYLASPKMDRNPSRKMAAQVNAAVAVLLTCRHIMTVGGAAGKRLAENFQVPQVNKLIADLAKDCLVSVDSRLRLTGSELIGRLSAIAGVQFMSTQIQMLVDCVVSDTLPTSRAGCALSLGSIFSHVGSLSAGPVLRTIIDLLTSLAGDPHPLVHFWSIYSLGKVVDAANLTFSPYQNVTLGLIVRLYWSEAHEPVFGTAPANVNPRADQPIDFAMTLLLDAIIGVLGPELSEQDAVQLLVHSLLECFQHEEAEWTQVEAIKAMQHFLIFCPDSVDLPKVVSSLRILLASPRLPLKNAAINSVYQLVQRSALSMSKLGGNSLVEDLFALLDDNPSAEGVRDTILLWLKQTVNTSSSGWIDLCQRIMLRSTASKLAPGGQLDQSTSGQFTDEESQGLGLGTSDMAKRQAMSRWRTQLFALECIHQVVVTLAASGNSVRLLAPRISDLIKMAFSASTSPASSIRLAGLQILSDVLKNFARTKDEQGEGQGILEQFQAPIMAALTPAFEKDATPEVTSASLDVCAIFVASGGDPSRMNRIVKVLTGALDSCKESGVPTIGGVNNLSSTASALLRMSLFSAWAELYVSAARSPSLAAVVEPYLSDLSGYWLASLREYAKLKVQDFDTSSSGVSASAMEAGLDRDVVFTQYEACWSNMLRAISGLMKSRDARVVKAMKENAASASGFSTLNGMPAAGDKTPEPALFFYVVFGLAFEALSASSSSAASQRNTLIALQALEGCLTPNLAGDSLFTKSEASGVAAYDELVNLMARVASAHGSATQLGVLAVASAIARGWPKELALNHARMMTLLGVVMLVIQDQLRSLQRGMDSPALEPAFMCLLTVAQQCAPSSRSSFGAVALSLFGRILKMEVATKDVVGGTLPALRSLTETIVRIAVEEPASVCHQALLGLLAACLSNVEEVRQREGDSAGWKLKNNLLAAVLIVSGLPTGLKISQSVLDHLCSLILDLCREGSPQMQETALFCARSLIGASVKNTSTLQYCLVQLVPNIISVAMDGAAQNQPRQGEFLKLLHAFVAAVGTDRKAALDIVLPIYLACLAVPADKAKATQALIELASIDAAAFKQCTQDLDTSQKGALEFALRSSVQLPGGLAGGPKAEPTINLKAF